MKRATVKDVVNYLMKFDPSTEFKVILNDEPVPFDMCTLVNKDNTREVYFDLDIEE